MHPACGLLVRKCFEKQHASSSREVADKPEAAEAAEQKLCSVTDLA